MKDGIQGSSWTRWTSAYSGGEGDHHAALQQDRDNLATEQREVG